jgi:hypothetical protein
MTPYQPWRRVIPISLLCTLPVLIGSGIAEAALEQRRTAVTWQRYPFMQNLMRRYTPCHTDQRLPTNRIYPQLDGTFPHLPLKSCQLIWLDDALVSYSIFYLLIGFG